MSGHVFISWSNTSNSACCFGDALRCVTFSWSKHSASFRPLVKVICNRQQSRWKLLCNLKFVSRVLKYWLLAFGQNALETKACNSCMLLNFVFPNNSNLLISNLFHMNGCNLKQMFRINVWLIWTRFPLHCQCSDYCPWLSFRPPTDVYSEVNGPNISPQSTLKGGSNFDQGQLLHEKIDD